MFGEPSNPLYVVPKGVETRWASPENPTGDRGSAARSNGGRKGSAFFPLKAGETRVLASAAGASGVVRRIWVTFQPITSLFLRGVRLDFFFDGDRTPTFSVPFGDFFGVGLGRMTDFVTALFAAPEGKSFNCLVPMPFRRSMRIAITNETLEDIRLFFYDVDYTLGDEIGPDCLYFHAHYRRENPTREKEDYAFLPRIQGRGRFLGLNAGVIADRARFYQSWWGEGEVKCYIDGDGELPTLCGTGSEDYVGTGWGLKRFIMPYQGCTLSDGFNMWYCFYRYHVPDPIFFSREIRVTIQQIGCWGPDTKPLLRDSGRPVYYARPGLQQVDFSPSGDPEKYGLFERHDDWSSCAYFYLDRTESGLPSLPALADRIANLIDVI
ncbi:MAG TPA: glycoside hydrolase family 172 protein [Spirochaetia bacterium]|nr:glycoside hydrolase family 172 protein [Spirochaetia bacterium]